MVGYEGGGWESFYVLDLQDWSTRAVRDTYLDCSAIAITSDSRYALMGNDFDTFAIRVYDMQSLEVVRNLAGHGPGNWVRDIVITPDDRHALSAASSHIKVWDLENGREVATTDDTGKIQALALTPDARYVLSGSVDMFIKIWDWRTGKKVEQIVSGHTKAISDLAITPDGRHVVSSSVDGTLKIWDWQRNILKHTCTGHRDSVKAIAITPDGERVISASSDCTVRQWDIHTGEQLPLSPT